MITYIEAIFNATARSILCFSISSLIIIIVALAYQRITIRWPDSSWTSAVLWIHLAPLFLAPSFLAYLLCSLAINAPPSIRWITRSYSGMAIVGYFLHCGIGLLVIDKVFNIRSLIERKWAIAESLKHRTPSAFVPYLLLTFGPAVAFTFTLELIFHESMLAVPKFLSLGTTLGELVTYLRVPQPLNDDIIRRLIVCAIILGILLCLLAARSIPRVIGTSWLAHIAKRNIAGDSHQNTNKELTGPFQGDAQWERHSNLWTKVFDYSAVISVGTSTLFQGTLLLVVLGNIIMIYCRGINDSIINDVQDVLRTMTTPAIVSALLAIISTPIIVSVARRRDDSMKCIQKGSLFASIALIPPVLIGSSAVLILHHSISFLITYLALLVYSLSLFLFLSLDSYFVRHHGLRKAATNLGMSRKRRLLVMLLTSTGGIGWPALLLFVMLWAEDGIQVATLGSPRTIAEFFRCLGRSEPSIGVLLGVLFSFGIWLLLTLGLMAWDKFRYLILKRWILLSVFILFVAIPAVEVHASTQKIIISPTKILLSGSKEKRFSFKSQDSRTTNLYIGSGVESVVISRLELSSVQSTIHMIGLGESIKKIKKFSIEHVLVEKDISVFKQSISLEFENLSIDEIYINGQTRDTHSIKPRFDIEMEVSGKTPSSAGEIILENLTIGVGRVRLHTLINRRHPFLCFKSISLAEKMEISGPENVQKNVIDIDMQRIQVNSAYIIPSVIFRGIRLNGTIGFSKDPNDPGQAQLSFRDSMLEGKPFTIDYGNVLGNIEITDSQVRGTVSINAVTLESLKFVGIYGAEQAYPHNIEVKSKSIDDLNIRSISLEGLELTASQPSTRPTRRFEASNLQLESLGIPPHFIDLIVESASSGHDARRLAQTVRAIGYDSTSGRGLIGLTAFYKLKLAQISSVNRAFAFYLDWMTGLGIKMWKPIIYFMCMTAIYLFIRFVLMRLQICQLRQIDKDLKYPWKVLCVELLQGLLPDDPGIVLAGNTNNESNGLATCQRVITQVYRIAIFIQITALSVYLGQTALEL